MAPASSTAPSRRALPILPFVILAASTVAYFWFIDHFGLNTIWIDQRSDLGVLSHAYSGHLTLSTLWAQHTDNRILFPNLVVLLLAYGTRFNVLDEEFLSAGTLLISIAVLILGHRRRSPGTPWILYVPVAILMLSVVQSGNALWGFQFAWYLVLLALTVALVLCDSPKWTWLVTTAAVAAAVVGSYSSLQGLLIWPAGLLILLLRHRPRLIVFLWIGAAAVTGAIYFVNFNTQLGDTNGFIVHHPVAGARFFLFSVGNVIGAHDGNTPVVLGLLIAMVSLWLVISTIRRRNDGDATPLGAALICFGLLFALTITIGRASGGLDSGGGSRYTTYSLLTLVGCYLVLLSRRTGEAPLRPWERALRFASIGTVGAVIGLQMVIGNINGLDDARSWHDSQVQASRVIANIEKAPDSMIERVLVVNPYYVSDTRRLVRFAQVHHLSLFASEPAVRNYTRAGLPYAANSLATAVRLPKSGSTVKGVVLLGAGATSDFGITKVTFAIDGPQPHSTIVDATHTDLGWLAGWNTVTEPNGRYTIRSVASDAGGHQKRSDAITIEVRN